MHMFDCNHISGAFRPSRLAHCDWSIQEEVHFDRVPFLVPVFEGVGCFGPTVFATGEP